MDNSKGADQRRNVFDIVADLGFLDRKPQPRLGPPPARPIAEPPPAEAVVTPPPALTLVKPQPQPPPGDLVQTLTEAQLRAAEQRKAAERLLQEAIELEERLADEAARQLAAALDDMRAAERTAAEHAEVCRKNVERIAERRVQAELQYSEAAAAEKAARAEALAADEAATASRSAREDVEQRLRGIQEHAAAVPADAATRIAERRAADAAKRIADRQAADAQRGAAS